MLKKFIIIILLGCYQFSHAEDTIRLGMDYWPGYYPAILANQLGYFERENLKVEITIAEDIQKILDLFAANQIDAMCSSAGDIIPLFNHSPDYKIVYISDLSAGGDALISNSKYLDSSKKLTIGVDLNTFSELFVKQFLDDYRISKDKVGFVNIDPSQATELLASGQFDLVHTWDPHLSEAVSAGAHILYTSRQTPGLIPDVLAFRASFLQAKPEQSKKFISAWLKALNWWQNNLDAGNKLISNYLQLDTDILLKNLKLMDREDNIKSLNGNGPRDLPKVIQTYIDFYLAKGILLKPVTADQIISDKYL